MASDDTGAPTPTILPLGDQAMLVRFGESLSDAANVAAISLARELVDDPLPGVIEIVPNLVSVLLRYDPARVHFTDLAGELRLRLYRARPETALAAADHLVAVAFGGEDGPDLDAVASALTMTPDAFIAAHNTAPLRVLATGFAPGFVYCGFHDAALVLPRRTDVRPAVPPGTVLFAAGQTAIAATTIPTGWHVIGRTSFRNFDPAATPPTSLRAGDGIRFERVP